jgi:hypothetical protein
LSLPDRVLAVGKGGLARSEYNARETRAKSNMLLPDRILAAGAPHGDVEVRRWTVPLL